MENQDQATVTQTSEACVQAHTVNVTQSGIQRVEARFVDVQDGGIGLTQGENVTLRNGGIGIAFARNVLLKENASAFLVFAEDVEGNPVIFVDVWAALLGGLLFGVVVGLLNALWRRK